MSVSITARLSLFFGLASAVLLAIVGTILYRALDAQLAERDTEELMSKLSLARHLLSEISGPQAIAENKHRLDDVLVAHSRLQLTLMNREGERLFGNAIVEIPRVLLASVPQAPAKQNEVREFTAPDGRPFRAVFAQAPYSDPAAPPAYVALALDVSEHRATLARYFHTLAAVLLGGAMLAAALGWIAARRGLWPVREIARSSARVSAERLEEPLSVAEVPVELQELVSAFNEMLVRLARSFRQLEDFSSDIAHELRTPLNNLMLQTQIALSRDRGVEDYQRVLLANLEEFERLARMTSDMLFLAKADHDQLVLHRTRVDLRSEIDKVIEFYQVLASERGVRLIATGRAVIQADRSLVQRAITNLMSNAVHHTPDRGEVRAELVSREDGSVLLWVTNPGAGIPVEHANRIFDRFARADLARERSGEGAGLGLAIVSSIMTMHQGEVSVRSTPGESTTFELRFPPVGVHEPCIRKQVSRV